MAASSRLEPLAQRQWETIQQDRIPEYAKEQIKAGRWSNEEAMAKATEEFENLLPDGVKTAKNHVYGIIDQANDGIVGYLWYVEREKAGKPCVFICDLRVFEAYRRQGVASSALRALEDLVQQKHGTVRIELHVFGNNHAARALYETISYEETNVLMAKDIA